MKISNQIPVQNNPNNVQFTSVTPIEVIGTVAVGTGKRELRATQREHISAAMRALAKILQGHNKINGSTERDIVELFKKNVPDYTIPKEKVETGSIIRHQVVNNRGYLFSGGDAEAIDQIGRQFGPAKGMAKIQTGSPNSLEVNFLINEYRSAFTKLVDKVSHRLSKIFNEEETPREAKLVIYANCPIKKTKKGQKYDFKIQRIAFEPDSQYSPFQSMRYLPPKVDPPKIEPPKVEPAKIEPPKPAVIEPPAQIPLFPELFK